MKKLMNLKKAKTLNKVEQKSINGGINNCIRACRQDFADCRELGYSHCSADLAICKSFC